MLHLYFGLLLASLCVCNLYICSKFWFQNSLIPSFKPAKFQFFGFQKWTSQRKFFILPQTFSMGLGSLSIWSLCVTGNLSLIKVTNFDLIILPNQIAVKFSVKSTRGAIPFVDIAPLMWIFRGCFDFGLNLHSLPTLLCLPFAVNHHSAFMKPYHILKLFFIHSLLLAP